MEGWACPFMFPLFKHWGPCTSLGTWVFLSYFCFCPASSLKKSTTTQKMTSKFTWDTHLHATDGSCTTYVVHEP
uniref:Uncharacterized protein n=1 Tax=Physcomitrium patens TaxID=3218 RepID=A0A2K1JD86_PHYPA|nr:hypothetical protein PHYPA_019779 [Physcomitrium patens]